MESANREISRKREEVMKAQKQVDTLADDVATMKQSVSHSAAELTRIRSQISAAKEQVMQKEQK